MQPAIKGGQPVREEYLPYVQHWVSEEEIKAVEDVLRSDFITGGPKIEEYEKEMAKYLGCKEVIATSSCTGALHICLTALKIKPGNEVITSNLTFAATPSVSTMIGAKPIIVDILDDTYTIDPLEIKKHINENTKALMPVHYSGHPCEMDEIMELGLPVIEDAAHAISASYKGKKIGTIGKAACFSFHPIKNMTMGEGGIIATNDQDFAEQCRLIRLHGLSQYKMVTMGYKYTINDIQAALGLTQLKKLDFFEQRRTKYAKMYMNAFKDNPCLINPGVREYVEHSWHLFILRIKEDSLRINRDQFREALLKENIGTQIHFVPINQQPYYMDAFKDQKFPNTTKVHSSMMTLPLFPKMQEADVLDVIEAVTKITNFYKK